MAGAITEVMDCIEGDPAIRVLVFIGEGRASSAGGDLKGLDAGEYREFAQNLVKPWTVPAHRAAATPR